MPTLLEIRRDAGLERGQPLLLEPGSFRLRERRAGEVGEAGRARARAPRAGRLGHQALEPVQVELVAVDAEP